MKKAMLILGIAALIFSCKTETAKDTATEMKISGIAVKNIDSTVVPGNDFFEFANGTWMKTAEMYPGTPFNGNMIRLTFGTEDQIGEILKDVVSAGEEYPNNSPKGQIMAFYQSYMDTITRNKLGAAPIKPELDSILNASSKKELTTLMTHPVMPSIWSEYVFLDSKNTNQYKDILGQRKLGIGGKEYYVDDKEPNPAVRSKYLEYIEKLFTLAGIDKPSQRAKAVLNAETAMATKSWTATERRDPNKMYHLMTVEELKNYAPGFDWDVYLNAKGGGNIKDLIVNTDTAVKGIAELMDKLPLDDLKSLMAFYLLNSSATFLSADFEQAYFEFFSKTLQGVPTMRPLEQRANGICNEFLKWQLGELYSDKYLTPEVEENARTYIGYMQKAILKRLENNEWMDEETKKEAVNKFNNINWKIGRPEKLVDLSVLEYKPDDFVGNLRKISNFMAADDRNKLQEPKRKWEWLRPPQIVNAYYQAEMNDVVIPIGILQAPVFDPTADAAANFGGILAVVGHEVGHAFDDKGSKSDANGLLRNWWSDASRADFENRANMLAAQYDEFEPLPGLHMNGQLTLGENLGDLGGVAIAYSAYRDYVADKQNGEAPIIDGLTGDQRFFLAYGQLWSWISTDDYLRMQVLSDYHSPGKYRVNGVVRNVDAWYDAFNVKPGDSLYLPPDKRVKIW